MHVQDPGEYLAKLGRVYMDSEDDPWAARLKRLLGRLEDDFKPTVVLLESRSGLHDIAAACVTDIDARVLLFAIDSNSTWTDYGILFRHWREHGLAGASLVDLEATPVLQAYRDFLRRFDGLLVTGSGERG